MGKLIEAIRKLGTKMTGKQTVESNSLVKVINDIADDYEGGGTTYTAGDNITIQDGVISATDTTYTAGKGVDIAQNNVINNTLSNVLAEINISSETISKATLEKIVDLTNMDFIYGNVNVIAGTERISLTPISHTSTSEGTVFVWNTKITRVIEGEGLFLQMSITVSDTTAIQFSIGFEEKRVGVSSSYLARLYARVNGYTVGMIFSVNDNTLETYSDLVNYFLNIQMDENYYIPASGYDGEVGAIIGIGLGFNEDTQTDALSVIAVSDIPNTYLVEDDISFEITYLG